MVLTPARVDTRLIVMTHTERPQTEGADDLEGWDWHAELKRQERSIPWLARQTDRSQHTVYQYAGGHRPTPVEWLGKAWTVLMDGVR
jgi:hypothetical protein